MFARAHQTGESLKVLYFLFFSRSYAGKLNSRDMYGPQRGVRLTFPCSESARDMVHGQQPWIFEVDQGSIEQWKASFYRLSREIGRWKKSRV